MIAIIGTNEDDILYFKTKMNHMTTVSLLGELKAYRGTLMNEEAVVVASGETDFLSALTCGIILSRFSPYLVFNVGACCSFSPRLKQGDLFIADRYYDADVDFSAPKLAEYGEIPGRGRFLGADASLNEKAEKSAYLLTSRYIERGYLLSGERFYMSEAPLRELIRSHFLLEEGLMAYDSSSFGIALACQSAATSLITIRAVSYQIGKEDQKLNYHREGLLVMPTIGKIVTRFLIERENG